MSYLYNKSILFELSRNYNKVIIQNSVVVTKNFELKRNDISDITFYTTDKKPELPFDLLPVYFIEDDFDDFVLNYQEFIHKNNITDYSEINKFLLVDTLVFDDKEECKKNISYKQTNHKFENFNQLIYHCGDKYDFERYGSIYFRTFFDEHPELNHFSIKSIYNTFSYLFDYLKKGILVIIKNNKLFYLPFSKSAYRNKFLKDLYFDDEDKKLIDEYIETNNTELKNKLKLNVKHKLGNNKEIELDREKWYANNYFFRIEKWEGDKDVTLYKNLFETLCSEREVSDSIFFLNIRDNPVLRDDLTNPYFTINQDKIDYEDNFIPILSVCGHSDYRDKPMITPDDWLRVQSKSFLFECKTNQEENNEMKWEDKIDKAVFRGTGTGYGTTPEDNMRIKLAVMGQSNPDLDVGLTGFNRKVKKTINGPLKIFNPKKYNLQKAEFMSFEEQMKHKYIIHIDGHVAAFRLAKELNSGSVILKQDSEYKMWYSDLLEPYKHYVPIKRDLSDLEQQIQWCRDNTSKCIEIIRNAREVYNNYLGYASCLDFMKTLIDSIKLTGHLRHKTQTNKIGIITIFRDDESHERLKQKRIFLYLMTRMLKHMGEYKIIVVEQSGTEKFNIGKLKNIGYDILRQYNFDNYVFTDIDLIPSYDLLHKYFKITEGMNTLAHKGTRYNYTHNIFLGGCISCKGSVFESINGYSNNFWGWGGEDDNIGLRCIDKNITFYIPKKGFVIDIEEKDGKTMDIQNKVLNVEKNKLKWELNVNFRNYETDGLNSLQYNILEQTEKDNIIEVRVDIGEEYKSEFSEVSQEEYYNVMKLRKHYNKEYF